MAKDEKIDELIDHYETVATIGRIAGRNDGLHGVTAEYLKRLKYYEEAIQAGKLVWKEV